MRERRKKGKEIKEREEAGKGIQTKGGTGKHPAETQTHSRR
jgi:hypothetical protein